MSVEIKYNFDDSADYTFDPTFVEVTGGVARLRLANQAGQTFTQDFSSDTGFTYDSSKAEFSGGQVQQKNQIPADANFGAVWDTTINANWGSAASLIPTSTKNSPTISGGKLDLISDKNVVYNATGAINAAVGTIKFKYTPNYTGAPSNTQQLFYFGNPSSTNNRMHIDVNAGTGAIVLRVYSSTGADNGTSAFGNWTSNVAGTEYEIEFNWDFINFEHRLFIDGVQQSGTSTKVSTRDNNLTATLDYRQGGFANSDHEVGELVIFDVVQHTSDYTPGYTLPSTTYAETAVIFPAFNYSGLGNIQIYESIANTAFGNGKYIINGRYHDGGNWVLSDGSYSQSNSVSEINANIASSPVSDSIIMTLVFPEGGTQNYVSNFVFTYTGQYYVSGSTIKPNGQIPITAMTSFIENAVIPANTNIKYTLEIDGVENWFNGASWQISNATLAQTNTASDVNANVGSIPIGPSGSFIVPKIYFETDGSDRSEIQDLCLIVTYDVNPIDKPDQTIIFGSLRDMVAEEMTGTAALRIVNDDQFFISGNSIQPGFKKQSANSEGIAAIVGIIKTESIDYKYSFYIDYFDADGNEKTKSLGKSIAPDAVATNIANLTYE